MNVVALLPVLPAFVPIVVEVAVRRAYSFDITQPDARGMVLLDACVPLPMAVAFMNLLALYLPPE